MSFFKVSKNKEDIEQSSGSNYLNKSGAYPVNIVAPFVSVAPKGSVSVDMFLDHQEQKQVIYGNLRIQNNDGGTNAIGTKIFNQLAIIADVEEISDPVDAELPIGKEGAAVDVGVLEDLTDIDVVIRIQLEYSVYNSNIQEKKVIKGFYRAEDNASAEEIVNGTEAGVQYKKDSQWFDNITYNNGLDAEAVQAWVKAKRPKGTGVDKGDSKASASKVVKPTFKKKSSFGK